MKRYDLKGLNNRYMAEVEDGDYVLYEDVKKLTQWIRDKLENSCVGCDYFKYRTDALSWSCNHPTHGRWLESGDDGVGCEDNTEIKKILN